MKLRKIWKQGLAILLAGVLILGLTSQSCRAAVPVKLAKKSVTLSVTTGSEGTIYGKSTIKIKTGKGTKVVKVTYKTADKKIATVNQKGKVIAKKAGQTKVAVKVKYRKNRKVYTKKLTYKVKVVERTYAEATATSVTNVLETNAPERSSAPARSTAPAGSSTPAAASETLDDSLKEPGVYLKGNDGTYTLKKSWEQLETDDDISVTDGVLDLSWGMKESNEKNMKWVLSSKVTSIGEYAFYGCDSVTGITIPESVTSIGDCAFAGCSNLTDIKMPESVNIIGWSAFEECSSLMSIEIPDGVKCIEGNVFEGCSSLTSITIPESVTSIGNYAFYGCSNLTDIIIPESVTSIGWSVFEGTKWLENERDKNPLVILHSILIDGQECTGKVVIPNDVTSIGDFAFKGCNSLTGVEISDSVTGIGKYAFYDCSNLTDITIPDSVTDIGEWVFSGCDSLTSLVLPSRFKNDVEDGKYGIPEDCSVTYP